MALSTLLNTTRFARYATLLMLALSLFDIADYLFGSGSFFATSFALQESIMIITVVTDFVLLALLIVNLRWIYVAAAYYQSRAEQGAIRPGWAVWSNFIPFINLWSPYVQITRIWGVSAGLRLGFPVWLKVWWGAWIFQYIAAIVIVALMMNMSDPLALETSIRFVTPVFVIVDILGTWLFYLIITKIGAAYATDADVFN